MQKTISFMSETPVKLSELINPDQFIAGKSYQIQNNGCYPVFLQETNIPKKDEGFVLYSMETVKYQCCDIPLFIQNSSEYAVVLNINSI